MAKTNVTAKDRDRFAHARARGRSRVQDPSTVVVECAFGTRLFAATTLGLAIGLAFGAATDNIAS